MTVELLRRGSCWTVVVDGQVAVSRESYQVASNVVDHLEHPERFDASESASVAASIRSWRERP